MTQVIRLLELTAKKGGGAVKKLYLYWADQFGEEQGLVGTLWIEEGRLLVRPCSPELGETIEGLVEWFSTRNLCSREIIDFLEYSAFSVAAECRMEDEDYLEMLAEAAAECPLEGRQVRGSIALA